MNAMISKSTASARAAKSARAAMNAKKRIQALKWGNAIAFVAMVGVNAAANIVPFGGNTTGEVSAAYPNLFTPAPVTFSIWGIIYVLMGVFVVAQFLPLRKRGSGGSGITAGSSANTGAGAGASTGGNASLNGISSVKTSLTSQVGPWFIVSCVLNIAWMITWHFQLLELSLVLMFALLASLIFVNYRADFGGTGSVAEKIATSGFQVYLGWITAATIANASVLLVSFGWDGFGLSATFWTIAVLIVGGVLGALLTIVQGWVFGTLAVMWAYAGILIKHVSTVGFGLQYPLVIIALLAVLLGLFAVVLAASSPRIEADEFAWSW